MYESLKQFCTDNPSVQDFNYTFVDGKCIFVIKPTNIIGNKTIICNYIDLLDKTTTFIQDLIIVVF